MGRLLLCVAWLLTARLVWAGPPAPLRIPYLAEAPTIDGQPDDWAGPPAADWRVFAHRPALRNRARVWLGWDETNLYALYRVADHHLVQLERGTGNPRLYFNDAVELYVDAPGDSRRVMDVNDYQFVFDLTGSYIILKGDKRAALEGWSVPKEIGTATLLPRVAATHAGSLNHGADLDSGYVVEVAVPWAGLGVRPRAGHRLRLDACVEDMDSVFNLRAWPAGRRLRVYSFESWTGSRDFGYPATWRPAVLTGGPDALAQLSQRYPRRALQLAALLAALLGLLTAYHAWRVRQLRQIPVRAGLSAAQRRVAHPAADVAAELSAATSAASTAIPEASTAPLAAAGEAVGTSPGTETGALPHEALFAQCREFVLANLGRDLGPAELANHAAVSVRNLQRFFRDELELTPAAFIVQVRLEAAAGLLCGQPRLGIGEVAEAVGFADTSYFGRLFKRYFGLTPREYGRRAAVVG